MPKEKQPIRFARLSMGKVLVIDGNVTQEVFDGFKKVKGNSEKLKKVTTLRYDSGYVDCELDLPKIKELRVTDIPEDAELKQFKSGFIKGEVPTGFVVSARNKKKKQETLENLVIVAFGGNTEKKGNLEEQRKIDTDNNTNIIYKIKFK